MSDLANQTRTAQRQGQQVAQRSQDLAGRIAGQRAGLAAALSERIGAERFIRAAVTQIRTTPKLAECSDDSILGALYIAAQLGLEIGGPRGLVYLVPYGREATLVVGYRGFVDLFYRAGARSVQWFIVREGDLFRIASDAVQGLVYQWEPLDLDDSRPMTGAVAQVQTSTGGLVWEFMTKAQIEARRPKSWKGTPWASWFEEMSLKTVLRQLAKRVQMSTDLALATSADETVQRRVEVPGLPAEHRVEHVPVSGPPAVEGRSEQPAPQRRRTPVASPEMEPEPVDNMPEPPDDWEARERAEADAYLAEHEGDR